MFDLVSGLPVHALVVHAAVVLYPLGIIGVLACVLAPRLRRHYGWPSVVLLALGALFVLVAKESGEALARRVGEPRQHAEYADLATAVAGVLTIVTLLWWLLDRLRARRAAHPVADAPRDGGATVAAAPTGSALGKLLAAATALLSVAGLVTLVLVGHSGAEAVWQGRVPTATTAR